MTVRFDPGSTDPSLLRRSAGAGGWIPHTGICGFETDRMS